MTAPHHARPHQARLPREVRREQLLVAAQEVFVAQGYHAAAMDDIAEHAGVSKPVLYQHFPGKLELYLALLEQHCDELVDKVRTALASTTDNKQRVAGTFHAFFEFVAGEGEAFRLVFESDLRNVPEVRDRAERALHECAEMISRVIQEDTGVDIEEAHLLAMGLVGMGEVSARYWERSSREMTREEAEHEITRLAWRGIGGFPLSGESASERK